MKSDLPAELIIQLLALRLHLAEVIDRLDTHVADRATR